jgi:hypothetical protein
MLYQIKGTCYPFLEGNIHKHPTPDVILFRLFTKLGNIHICITWKLSFFILVVAGDYLELLR